MEVGIITKAATFKGFFHLSYKNAQLLFLLECFLIFSWGKHYWIIFRGYTYELRVSFIRWLPMLHDNMSQPCNNF